MLAREAHCAQVHCAAAPERVYAALAAPGGATGWWSTRGGRVTSAGERLHLDWSDADFVEFEVEVAERPTAMRWRCVAQHDRNLPEVDEWVGTVLTFRITPSDGGSRLQFEHEGLMPALECYGACERGWDFFLRRSVRQLIATGSGLPYGATCRSDSTRPARQRSPPRRSRSAIAPIRRRTSAPSVIA